METYIYKYGLPVNKHRTIQNQELVDEQLRLAHNYYNKLIEIERNKREKTDEIDQRYGDVAGLKKLVAEKKEVVVRIEAKIKRWRVKARKKRTPKEMASELRAAKIELTAAKAEYQDLRKAIKENPEAQALKQEVYDEAHAANIEARGNCGVHWGTYVLIESAVDSARKAPGDPSFRRWDGNGQIGVQIQKRQGEYMGPDLLFSCEDTRIRIEPVPSTAWDKGHRTEQRTTLWLRVGSEGKAPIWAKWPLILHRPLPEDASIVGAKVTRKYLAGKPRWSLLLTIKVPERAPVCGEGVVSVDFGWRKMGEETRVGFWQDEAGNTDSILLDSEIVGAFQKVRDLQSIRDKNLNAVRASLRERLKGKGLPEWLSKAKRHMHLWKSPKRFASLALFWRDNRWKGDAEGYTLLEDWRKQDKHLWLWEANLRDKTQARRLDYYRNLAADLSSTYRTLVINDFDFRDTQRHVPLESEETEIQAVRRQQKEAWCSGLRNTLKSAFYSRGGEVVTVPAEHVTQTCNACGYNREWRDKKALIHTCENCGATFDRDVNSTLNMLARAREVPRSEWKRPEKKASKWARLGRHKGHSVASVPMCAKGMD